MLLKSLKVGLNGLKNDRLYKMEYCCGRNFNLSKPTIICPLITYKCTFQCKQCGIWKREFDELDTSQWKKIILDLRRWIGPFYMSICGGEPFVREDLLELVNFSNNLGIVTDVITNGSLIDQGLAEEIAKSKLDKITFSLDGANPQTHDSLRNFEGAFDQVVKAIKILHLTSPKLNISVNTTIMSKNLGELKSLVNFVIKYGLNGIYFRGLICSDLQKGFDNDTYDGTALWPKDHNKPCEIIDELIGLKRSGCPISNSVKHLEYMKQYFKDPHSKFENLNCLRPMRSLIIRADGSVIVCDTVVGSLLSTRPEELWNLDRTLSVKRQKMKCKRSCMLRDPGDLGDSLADKFRLFYHGLRNDFRF